MLHYLLDGYNLIHQMPQLNKSSRLEDQRLSLINFIELSRPQGSYKNKVTIVFDGKTGFWHNEQYSAINVVFSCDESADEKIKKIVRESPNKKNIVVVTNDRDIIYCVRSEGAITINVSEFLSKTKDPKSLKTKEKWSKKNISKTLEHEITSELKKIWIDNKKKS